MALTTVRRPVVIAGTRTPLDSSKAESQCGHARQGLRCGGSVIDRLVRAQDSDPWAIPRAPTDGEAVVLVHQRRVGTVDDTLFDELTGLALAAGAQVLARLHARRHRPEPGGFLGKGKTLELAGLVESHCATLVIVDQRLSPIQERNMERVIRCRVIDRTRLILDIFALRARSREGQLQVELAQLRYLSTRLVRGWSHLERQRGGIGLRGPGEMQLETDRRLLGSRISRLKKQLERVRAHRSVVRRGREKLPLVSMVGYTNAGKSSLFNGLTGANVLVADQLFATLDSTIRKMEVAGIGTVLLSDTVGFIQGLPTTLIEAFRGTLEEVGLSNLLLHVVDMSDPQHLEHSHQVEETLEEIGAGAIPRIAVLNKIDQVDMSASVRRFGTGEVRSVAVSAATGEGMTGLQGVIAERLSGVRVLKRLRLPPTSYRLRAQVYSLARVESERIDEDGYCVLDIEIGAASEGRLAAQKEFNVAYWTD